SGALEGVRGIVFGDMKGCAPKADEDYELDDVLVQALEGLEVPIAIGLSSGHTTTAAVTVPFGVRARLTAGDDARLEVLAPASAARALGGGCPGRAEISPPPVPAARRGRRPPPPRGGGGAG